MEYKVGRSNQRQAKDAVNEAVKGFGKPKLILSFSGVDQFEECHKELAARFPDTFAKETGREIGAYIRFSGYGEQLNQQHFNQTMALAVFE